MGETEEVDIICGRGMTDLEKYFIREFYRKNPESLKRLNNIAQEDNTEEKILDKNTPEKFYTFTYLTKFASYEKIKKLVQQNKLVQEIHFIEKNGKKLWKDKAIETIKETYCLTEEESKRFEALYFYFTDTKNMSLNKLSIEVSKVIDKTERAVYAFFYTFFSKRRDKQVMKPYMDALILLKERMEEKDKKD